MIIDQEAARLITDNAEEIQKTWGAILVASFSKQSSIEIECTPTEATILENILGFQLEPTSQTTFIVTW